MKTKYGFGTVVNCGFSEAIDRVTHALQQEGFGVLTEIDVAATMKKKLDKDMPPYRILGACNPTFAHQAISSEPSIGLLLPCNVVVRQDNQARVHVEFMDPEVALEMVDKPDVHEVAKQVRSRLYKVLQSLEAS